MCEELEPEFEYAASKYDESDEILFARVDGRAEPKIAEALGVTAFPIFKFYNKGSSDPVRLYSFTNLSIRIFNVSSTAFMLFFCLAVNFLMLVPLFAQTPFYYVHYKGRHGHTFMKKVNERLGKEPHPEL